MRKGRGVLGRLVARFVPGGTAPTADEAPSGTGSRLQKEGIVAAAEAGDLKRVRELLASAPELDYPGAAKLGTALHGAAAHGHADVVRMLLDHNACAAVADEQMRTQIEAAMLGALTHALLDAAENGHKDVVELLLARHPAGLNAVDDQDCAPLHRAAFAGHRAIADLLLTSGAAVDGPENIDWTPLHCAAANGKRDVAELLLANNANVNAKHMMRGWTPLHYAASGGDTEVARLLLAHHAEVNAKSDDGETPLALAARKGDAIMAALLRQHGAE